MPGTHASRSFCVSKRSGCGAERNGYGSSSKIFLLAFNLASDRWTVFDDF